MITELDLSSEKAKKQYYGIDLMKFICAIFVVEIHVPPLKDISPFFNYILGDRLCVVSADHLAVQGGLTDILRQLAVGFSRPQSQSLIAWLRDR